MHGIFLLLSRMASSTILSSAFLLLDGRVGPLSSELRSATASTVLAAFVIAGIGRPVGWLRMLATAAMIGLGLLITSGSSSRSWRIDCS